MAHTWMLEKRGRPRASERLNIFESAQQRGRRESAYPIVDGPTARLADAQ